MTEAPPTTVNRTLRRLTNATYRPREYLTEAEVDRLIEAARKRGRNGARDAAAILLAYRHGLRAAELCQLRWSQIDLKHQPPSLAAANPRQSGTISRSLYKDACHKSRVLHR
jgi:integrase